MTVEEIFNKIATHMKEGTIYHNEMAQIYNFIGLWGFAQCQYHHFFEEQANLQCLANYYTTHYFKLLQLDDIPKHDIIPGTWFKYTTQEVDINTKRNTVKELMTTWVNWEKETKIFYQTMRQELTSIGELDAAIKLDEYIIEVSKELCHAQKKLIKLETVGYDIQFIIEWQEPMLKKYKKKLGW